MRSKNFKNVWQVLQNEETGQLEFDCSTLLHFDKYQSFWLLLV